MINTSITEVKKRLAKKEISATELTKACLEQIQKTDNTLGAFINVYPEQAIKKAQELDAKGYNPEQALWGIPVSVKDALATKNMRTTAGSKILETFTPPYSAFVIEELEKAGAIILGKNNMDEFAMGSTGDTSFYGSCKNPWDNTKSTGGSSSGCASSLAYNESIITLGSDTGGSIRQPSSFCCVTGIKPSYGVVSRYGLVSFAPQFDQIGPIGKDALDCAKILEIISGYDKNDTTTIKKSNYTFIDKNFNINGLKIGICKNFIDYSNKDVQEIMLNAISIFKSMGAILEEIDLNVLDYSIPTYQILSSVQCVSNMARYDGIKYGYNVKNIDSLEQLCVQSRTDSLGLEVKKRIIFGNFILRNKYDYYTYAINAKNYITKQFKNAFNKYDILLSPTTPTTAISNNEDTKTDIFLTSSNICSLPSISIPCGFTKNNMPVGMQLIGNYLKDDVILNTAIQFQKNTNFHCKNNII